MDNVVPLRRPERVTRPEPLWREAVGAELRASGRPQGRTLADVAGEAGVSMQYLSEVERGLKDAELGGARRGRRAPSGCGSST